MRRGIHLDAALVIASGMTKERVDFGIYLPQVGFSYAELRERALLVEELGFHSLWLMDHLYPPEMPNVPSLEAWTTATALLVYSLFVAALVMLGAKIGKLAGERLVFQAGVVLHGGAMALMAISTDVTMMNTAQAIAGVAASIGVPTFVVLIAAN